MARENRLSSGFWVFVIDKYNAKAMDMCFATYEILYSFEKLTFGAVIPILHNNIQRYWIKGIGIVLKERKKELLLQKRDTRPICLEKIGKWIYIENPVPNGFMTMNEISKRCGTIKTMGLPINDLVPYYSEIERIIEEN